MPQDDDNEPIRQDAVELDQPTRALSLQECQLDSIPPLSTPPPTPFAAAREAYLELSDRAQSERVSPQEPGGSTPPSDCAQPETVAPDQVRDHHCSSGRLSNGSGTEIRSNKRDEPSAQRTKSDASGHVRRRKSHNGEPESTQPAKLEASERALQPSCANEKEVPTLSLELPECEPISSVTLDELGRNSSGLTALSNNEPWRQGFTSYASFALNDGDETKLLTSAPSSPVVSGHLNVPSMFWGKAQAQGNRPYFEDRFSIRSRFQPTEVLSNATNQVTLPTHPPCLQQDAAAHSTSTTDVKRGEPSQSAEDNWAVQCSYAGVFDGHVAANAAQAAAQRLHVLLAGELSICARDEDGELQPDAVITALRRSFAAIDFEILTDAARTGDRSGSTACVILQLGKQLFCAHTGDSIAVLVRDGTHMKLTAASDHRVDDPIEAKRIKSKGGKVIDGGTRITSPNGQHSLNMSRALGDADYKCPRRLLSAIPDIKHIAIERGDTAVVVATDGLWDVSSEADATRIIAASLDCNVKLKAEASGSAIRDLANSAAEALVRTAQHRGSEDDVTALVGLIKW